MKIKAAVARAKAAPLCLETVEVGDPRPGEVLIRVHASGICHTDLAMRDQTFPVPQPIVLGHEGAGVIAAVGAGVTGLAVGDHVATSFDSCGECPICLEGEPAYCLQAFPRNFGGSRLDGSTAFSKDGEKIHSNFFGQSSFAEYTICHHRSVVKVPKEIPLQVLAPLGCGIATGAGAVMNVFKLKQGQSMVVFGAGAVGLAAILAARALGASAIIAVGRNKLKMDLAKQFGATHIIDGNHPNVPEAVKAIVPGGARYALDTTAVPRIIENAFASLGTLGMLGVLGVSQPTETMALPLIDAISVGKSVRGIVEGDAIPQVLIPKLIELYQQGKCPFDKMSTYYPFDKINEAIHDAESGKVIKAVLRMDVN
jgi:aryl-alcohol dehydrogenase